MKTVNESMNEIIASRSLHEKIRKEQIKETFLERRKLHNLLLDKIEFALHNFTHNYYRGLDAIYLFHKNVWLKINIIFPETDYLIIQSIVRRSDNDNRYWIYLNDDAICSNIENFSDSLAQYLLELE